MPEEEMWIAPNESVEIHVGRRYVCKIYGIKMPLRWRFKEWLKDGMRKMCTRKNRSI